MNILKNSVDETIVLDIEGRLDTTSYPQLEAYMGDLLKQGATKIVLNLSSLDYISSSGLRVILKTLKEIDQKGGALYLCGLNDHIMEIFEVSGFTELFQIYSTREEALNNIDS